MWAQFQQQSLLRDLALVITLAAMVAALADYLLKVEAVAYFGQGPQLVRFFGMFYAFTGLGAVLIQVFLGRLAIGRLGLGGSVASHPAVVGGAEPALVSAAIALAGSLSTRARRRGAQLHVPRRLRAALHPLRRRRPSVPPSPSSTSPVIAPERAPAPC